MSQASYLRDLASGDVPVDTARLNRSADTLEGAQTALSDTRRVMALLLDAAVCRGLKDTDPLAQRALRTIAAIDRAVPHAHDMGTGLPLRAIEATRPTDDVPDQRCKHGIRHPWQCDDCDRENPMPKGWKP